VDQLMGAAKDDDGKSAGHNIAISAKPNVVVIRSVFMI
jgi:hypothetical protein